LIAGPSKANRAVFRFEGHDNLTAIAIPTAQLSLAGPSLKLDAAHWPVRGDLAHIALAGKVFVPHYAVPMPRTVAAPGTNLLAANKADADVRETLAGGTVFNVLDVTGGWAWGQIGDAGFVGYLPVDALEAL
jgi:hypothetical protein